MSNFSWCFSVANDNNYNKINIISGLTTQATILAYMFCLVENGKITVPLAGSGDSGQNAQHVVQFLLELLKAAFPHLNE